MKEKTLRYPGHIQLMEAFRETGLLLEGAAAGGRRERAAARRARDAAVPEVDLRGGRGRPDGAARGRRGPRARPAGALHLGPARPLRPGDGPAQHVAHHRVPGHDRRRADARRRLPPAGRARARVARARAGPARPAARRSSTRAASPAAPDGQRRGRSGGLSPEAWRRPTTTRAPRSAPTRPGRSRPASTPTPSSSSASCVAIHHDMWLHAGRTEQLRAARQLLPRALRRRERDRAAGRPGRDRRVPQHLPPPRHAARARPSSGRLAGSIQCSVPRLDLRPRRPAPERAPHGEGERLPRGGPPARPRGHGASGTATSSSTCPRSRCRSPSTWPASTAKFAPWGMGELRRGAAPPLRR